MHPHNVYHFTIMILSNKHVSCFDWEIPLTKFSVLRIRLMVFVLWIVCVRNDFQNSSSLRRSLFSFLFSHIQFQQTIKTYLNDRVWKFYFYVSKNWPEEPVCLHFPGCTLTVNDSTNRHDGSLSIILSLNIPSPGSLMITFMGALAYFVPVNVSNVSTC